jgi:hypothetical protein
MSPSAAHLPVYREMCDLFGVPLRPHSRCRVVLYAAEDALHIVCRRLDRISAAAAAVGLADLDVQIITAPCLRLDLDDDQAKRDQTIARLKSRMLVPDPFVRLYRIDENGSGEVAALLAYLRDLQRRHRLAVVFVLPGSASGSRYPSPLRAGPLRDNERDSTPVRQSPAGLRRPIRQDHVPRAPARLPVGLAALFA